MNWRKSANVGCNLLVWKDSEEQTFVTLFIFLISKIDRGGGVEEELGNSLSFFLPS